MSEHMSDDLTAAGRDVRPFTDELRAEHAVVQNSSGEWCVLRHAQVVEAATDDLTYSSAVSRHLQVPNGLDGAMHDAFRALVDEFFTAPALAPYAPLFRQIADRIVADLPRDRSVDAVDDIGAVYAVRAQCGWLGWPEDLEPQLLDWMTQNHAATRSGDYSWTAAVAEDFDAIITAIVAPRRVDAAGAPDDLTTRLVRSRVQGQPLSQDQVVSILRNWTGGDLGSIALCVGVVVAHLAGAPQVLASLADADDEHLDAVLEEILRLDNPFVSNRRVTTRPTTLGGQELPAGARIKLHWTSANRDESVFGVDDFDPSAHRGDNLVYGVGRHVCPGRPLAALQMRALVRALIAGTGGLALDPDNPPEREISPVGGYRHVPVLLRPGSADS